MAIDSKVAPIPSVLNLPCILCDNHNPSKSEKACDAMDIEQARALGYCTYAIVSRKWAKIQGKEISYRQ